jgi:tetratricopeptide (TPR) repeat protein
MAQGTSNHSIGTHQIDRFEAIHLLKESLKSNPNDEAAWIVLGELAYEVAQDLSSQSDEPYYKLSQEAYEKALALQPKNAGLKAAAAFAREQKTGAAQWDQARRDAASSYIEVRKSELAASGFNPTVQAYSPPQRPRPPAAVAATISAPTNQPAVTYQYPVYQPYYVPGAQPYTYQQYAGGYLYTVPGYYTYDRVAVVTTHNGAHRRRSER